MKRSRRPFDPVVQLGLKLTFHSSTRSSSVQPKEKEKKTSEEI